MDTCLMLIIYQPFFPSFRTDKVKVQNSWFLQAAKDVDMILDEDELYPFIFY